MDKKTKEKIAVEFLKILKEKELIEYSEQECFFDLKGKRLEKPRYFKIFYPKFESVGVRYFKNMLKRAIDKSSTD